MNPDTAPIAEVESYLLERGMDILGRSIDAAIACLPTGCRWQASEAWWIAQTGIKQWVTYKRSNDPAKARDELIRLAAKAWIEHEKTLQTADCPPSSKDGCQ